MWTAIRSHRSLVADCALALVFFGAGLYELLAEPFVEDVIAGSLGLNVAAVALSTLPLAFRRVAPLPVVIVIFGAIAVRSLDADPLEIYPNQLAGLVAVYSVASYASKAAAVAGLVISIAAIEIAAVRGTGGEATPDAIGAPVLIGAVWAVGFVAGSRHARAKALERSAAERDRRRAEEAQAAVEAERRRIARELHDAVSHSLAMIAMQAGGAGSILRKDPERAEQSLRTIESAAREGLTEMRRLLGLIADADADPERSPQPRIDRIEALVENARAAGLTASLAAEGEPQPLSPAVEASAYRIVQEALTNAAKHAGRCHVDVRLRWQPEALEVEVRNDGAAAPDGDGSGRGLIGMRERASVLGGRFEAGRDGDAGFRVFASLPVDRAS